MLEMTVRAQGFPLLRPFTISRGTRTEVRVVTVELRDGASVGRGECTPYGRYGETEEGVMEVLYGLRGAVASGMTREELLGVLPAGAARSALDCALWDLECKGRGASIWSVLGRPPAAGLRTMATVSLADPDAMAEEARGYGGFATLKVKVGGDGVLERVRAVHLANPGAGLLVDANEAWTFGTLQDCAPELRDLGVVAIEQPLPADGDGALNGYRCPVPLIADESCHTVDDLYGLSDGYRIVNIKLDKCGGLTSALELEAALKARGTPWMVGCMMATSLALAPATVVAAGAALVDLDCPVLLREDRDPPLPIGADGQMGGIAPELWG